MDNLSFRERCLATWAGLTVCRGDPRVHRAEKKSIVPCLETRRGELQVNAGGNEASIHSMRALGAIVPKRHPSEPTGDQPAKQIAFDVLKPARFCPCSRSRKDAAERKEGGL